MIDILFEVGYTSTSKNKYGETVVKSLELASGEGKIPITWVEPIKEKYINITRKSAELTLREVCSKISSDNQALEKQKVFYCIGFLKAPEFAAQIAVEFCMKLTPGCIGRGIIWTPVRDNINMFKTMFQKVHNMLNDEKTEQYKNLPQEYFDFKELFVGWNMSKELQLFNTLVINQTFQTLESFQQNPENYETCYLDPLSGIIGECGTNEQIKAYIMQKLDSLSTMHLALYCISHSGFIDNDIREKLLKICENEEFEKNNRLKFATYDVIQSLTKQKICNFDQLKTYLTTKTIKQQVVNKSIVSDTCCEIVNNQLDETYCENLRSASKLLFDNKNQDIDAYIEKIKTIVNNIETNQHALIESFIARACYDVYTSDKLLIFSKVVKKCKEQNVFERNIINCAVNKMNDIELSDFYDSNILEEIKKVVIDM